MTVAIQFVFCQVTLYIRSSSLHRPPGSHPRPRVGAGSGGSIVLECLARTVADLFDRHDLAGGAEELFNSLDLVARVDAVALVRRSRAWQRRSRRRDGFLAGTREGAAWRAARSTELRCCWRPGDNPDAPCGKPPELGDSPGSDAGSGRRGYSGTIGSGAIPSARPRLPQLQLLGDHGLDRAFSRRQSEPSADIVAKVLRLRVADRAQRPGDRFRAPSQ